jgi:upstream activation factor subunit UAF30
MKSKRIPIIAAKELGTKHKKNQVIIITYDENTETTTVTTWGKTVKDSEAAATAGNAYKKALGFPAEKCKDVPSRVKRAKAKKTAKPRKKKINSLMQLFIPSEALSAIVGPNPIARTEIVKKIWEYIKKNKLQDKKNRRMINADEKLRPVFGNKEQVSLFDLAKCLGKHIKKTK